MPSVETLAAYVTEQRNEASIDIDSKSALEIVAIINNEDKKVPGAVERILPQIAALAEDIVTAIKKGGRLFYIGAGTSGRFGILDAAECPPTYGVEPGLIRALIAGGIPAFTQAVEAAEDRYEEGAAELKNNGFCRDDVLVGITASGSAPYVLGALEYAQGMGAVTGAISCNPDSKTFIYAKHQLYVNVGPEVITGSTRMKSGTAQKLILTMLSTTVMIRLGKVYKNFMVDLKPTNQKLVLRSLRLIMEITGCSLDEAETAFSASGNQPKIAIIMVQHGIDRMEAERRLREADEHISAIISTGKRT